MTFPFKWIAILVLMGSLTSCGLPMAAVRTVSNTVKSLGTAASNLGGAAGAAALAL